METQKVADIQEFRQIEVIARIITAIHDRIAEGETPRRVLVSDRVGIEFFRALERVPDFISDGITPEERWGLVKASAAAPCWTSDGEFEVRIVPAHDCELYVPLEL